MSLLDSEATLPLCAAATAPSVSFCLRAVAVPLVTPFSSGEDIEPQRALLLVQESATGTLATAAEEDTYKDCAIYF